jgi:hypothetical protein
LAGDWMKRITVMMLKTSPPDDFGPDEWNQPHISRSDFLIRISCGYSGGVSARRPIPGAFIDFTKCRSRHCNRHKLGLGFGFAHHRKWSERRGPKGGQSELKVRMWYWDNSHQKSDLNENKSMIESISNSSWFRIISNPTEFHVFISKILVRRSWSKQLVQRSYRVSSK